jgi:hypothetical protein
MMRRAGILLVILLATGIVACASEADRGSATATAVSNHAPDELVGVWLTTIGTESVSVTIEPRTYAILRGPITGRGQIDVVGAEITFHSGNFCSAAGKYRWAVDDDHLTFTAIGADPCSARAGVLPKGTYALARRPTS